MHGVLRYRQRVGVRIIQHVFDEKLRLTQITLQIGEWDWGWRCVVRRRFRTQLLLRGVDRFENMTTRARIVSFEQLQVQLRQMQLDCARLVRYDDIVM